MKLVDGIPRLADFQEVIIFVGGSTDNTWKAILSLLLQPSADSNDAIKALKQPGIGKGDAVRAGFAIASGEYVLILDADISVQPEELPRVIDAISHDKCEFANGSRLLCPMDGQAMRFLNLLGNKFFGCLFTFLLGQPVRDTLCGAKVLRREHYDKTASNREFFGDFDPFGDLDLLFGASLLGRQILDIPIHYTARTYGETHISRFRHGLLLTKMSAVAASRLKFIGP